jgi:hypothetical protein
MKGDKRRFLLGAALILLELHASHLVEMLTRELRGTMQQYRRQPTTEEMFREARLASAFLPAGLTKQNRITTRKV